MRIAMVLWSTFFFVAAATTQNFHLPMPYPLAFANLPPTASQIVLGVWLFALGGVIGSFLNVVIYRLPAGLSLSWPGSHCPVCGHGIRWFDNVPVFGWLRLRGRCRDCGVRISPRYPAVEAITAGVFLLVGVVEALSGGGNLPIRPEQVAGGMLWLPPTVAEIARIVAFHLLLISTLLAAAGIEYDRHRVPLRLWIPALAVGCLAPLIWPNLHPVAAWAGLTGPEAGLADVAAGAGTGAILGLVAWPIVGRRRLSGFCPAAVAVGVFLGWQVVLPVGLSALAMHAITRLLQWPMRRQSIGLPTMWLAVITLGWIIAWKPIVAFWPGLG